jgi:hypothetical protein
VEHESAIPQPEEEPTVSGYPRGRFNSLLVILGLMVAFVIAVQFHGLEEESSPGLQEAAIEADVSIKLLYAFDHWLSDRPACPRPCRWTIFDATFGNPLSRATIALLLKTPPLPTSGA